ncbi:MAG: Rieske 2Fe-2S domain-containing protein [Chloroflexi bacterium]|nr:Rieske 2Fe-2S domain-containing protein [Chloroflexota bacterium]
MAIEMRLRTMDLVREDMVRRRIFADPAIFNAEMKRIFGRTWVCVGHESEIPEPGDFKTEDIDGRPIILTRHVDGKIYALLNSCRHRGATVCEIPYGKTNVFRCPYHGWTYLSNGELISVPYREEFGPDFDIASFGLGRLPRVATYGGFLFVSFGSDGPDLLEHLGHAAPWVDQFSGRAPERKVQATKPVKQRYVGNWKLQLDNFGDNYHPQFVHPAGFGPRRRRQEPNGAGAQSSGPASRPSDVGSRIQRSFARGHAMMTFSPPRSFGDPPKLAEYITALSERVGPDEARRLVATDLHVFIYPNLFIQTNMNHFRIVRPLAVDQSEVQTYACRLVGAPDEYNQANLELTAGWGSPAGFVQVDDLEALTRVQRGLRADVDQWVLFKMGRDERVNEDGDRESNSMTDLLSRGFYREWARLMSEPDRR